MWQEHLGIVNRNIKTGHKSCWIFEIGNIFKKNSDLIQEEILNGGMYGRNNLEMWSDSGVHNDLNYYEARGKLKEALSSLNIRIDDKATQSIEFLHPGRSAKLYIEGKEAGYFGEINPKLIVDKKALKVTYLFSIKVKSILDAGTRKNKWVPLYKQFPTVPKMERDINLIFSKKYLISEIISQIRKSGNNLLEEVNLIDIFEDENLGSEMISYTFRLSYRDSARTLLDSDISPTHSNILSSLENKFNAKLKDQ